MSNQDQSGPAPGEQHPFYDPAAAHQQKPKLRPVRAFPAKVGDQQVLGLADARQISDKVVFTMPAAQVLLPLMDGSRSLDQIVSEVGRGLTRPMIDSLVAQLDQAGLIVGPTFDSLWAKVKTDFDASRVLPPASTAAFAEMLAKQTLGAEASEAQIGEVGPTKLREVFDSWIDKALANVANPSLDALPKAVVAPHIDYPRGWMNYAAIWGRLRVADRPDRVVILGTNHFGQSTGVCGCDKGYQTPFGTCEADEELVESMRARLGDAFYANRYDHEREHSIELQIAWIQHCLGADEQGNFCKVFGALVHDPAVNNGESYDGNGVGLQAFVDALKATIAGLPGKTLVVSSADLSHVGPAFGDRQPLIGETPEAAAMRERVVKHDREMLELYRQRKPDELVAAMAWQQNPTRWCSTGSLVATMLVAEPKDVQILNYAGAMDPQGMAMVSSVAMALS
jgi:AmmeMemoRadiSam system protein B